MNYISRVYNEILFAFKKPPCKLWWLNSIINFTLLLQLEIILYPKRKSIIGKDLLFLQNTDHHMDFYDNVSSTAATYRSNFLSHDRNV